MLIDSASELIPDIFVICYVINYFTIIFLPSLIIKPLVALLF